MTAHSVLVTCGGRWVGMIRAIAAEMQKVPMFQGGRLIVADRDAVTPAGFFADASVQVPPIDDPRYIDALCTICEDHSVGLVLPLIDIDMRRLAPHASRFSELGAHLATPSPELVDLCLDKILFQDFCEAAGLAIPRQVSVADLAAARYPLFYRRRRGFGSIGSGRADEYEDAIEAMAEHESLIFNEYVDAGEVTVDAYINRAGVCTVLVPRFREKVIGGEAQRATTFRNPEVELLAHSTIAALARRGLRGPLNVQLFSSSQPRLIEVNTRLGSCSVLGNAATGGRLVASILAEAAGGIASGDPGDFVEGLKIYRFTADVFYGAGSGAWATELPSGAPA